MEGHLTNAIPFIFKTILCGRCHFSYLMNEETKSEKCCLISVSKQQSWDSNPDSLTPEPKRVLIIALPSYLEWDKEKEVRAKDKHLRNLCIFRRGNGRPGRKRFERLQTMRLATRLEMVRASGTREQHCPEPLSGQWGWWGLVVLTVKHVCPWGKCFSKGHIEEVRLQSDLKQGAQGEEAEGFCDCASIDIYTFCCYVWVQVIICYQFIM